MLRGEEALAISLPISLTPKPPPSKKASTKQIIYCLLHIAYLFTFGAIKSKSI